MHVDRTGQIAVIFTSQRNRDDPDGYEAAGLRMEQRAAMPGFCGLDAARDPDGFGITISWWADEASAQSWRADAEHRQTQRSGCARWYDEYTVAVASVTRAYRWRRT